MPPQALALKLHQIMRKIQAKNRFVGSAYGTKLGLAESHLLPELAADPCISGASLGRRLRMSSMAISRLFSSLRKKGFVHHGAVSGRDKRKGVLLTAAGKRELRLLMKRSYQSMESFRKNMEEADYKSFLQVLARFADSYSSDETAIPAGQHPALTPIRKLTRAMGLLNSAVFGTKEVSSLEWHVLAEISESAAATRAKDLCALFTVPVNSMSTLLKRLETRALLERRKFSNDRRGIELRLTEKGGQILSEIESHAVRQIESAFCRLSPGEPGQLVALFEKFGGLRRASEVLLASSWVVKRLESEAEREAARLFLLKTLAADGWKAVPGEILFGRSSLNYALYIDSNISAVCEIQPKEEWHVANTAAPGVDPAKVSQFIEAVISEFKSRYPGRELVFDETAAPIKCNFEFSR
jgi:DNA-binding MarR family transcriptional regulator